MAANNPAPRFITVRNRPLSLWQSAVRQGTQGLQQTDPGLARLMGYAAGLHAEATVKHHPIPTPNPPPPGAPLTLEDHVALSKAYFDAVYARRRGDRRGEADAVAVIRNYSNWDLSGWASCEVVFAQWYLVDGNPQVYRDWVTQPAQLNYGLITYQLPTNAKILIIGDWGTGMTDAVAMLKAGVVNLQPDAIIHLGDVYYSGTADECQANVGGVIASLRSQTGLALPFFTMPGNHDYYSGGQGFYGTIDSINSGVGGGQQQASYFCLRSSDGNWQFLAMDTGYDDCDPTDDAMSTLTRGPRLHPTELVWHYDKLENFSGSTILLSHHQLYSAFSEINGQSAWGPAFLNDNLYKAFLPKFDRIAAWYWGHEHNFAQYPDQLGVQNCRLVGCSAYEQAKRDDPYDYKYKQINYGPIPPSTTSNQVSLSPHTTATRTFYNHMFALMTLNPPSGGEGPTITVDYYQYPSWDQDYSGPQPSTADKLCSETIEPAFAGSPDAGTKIDLIEMNGSPAVMGTGPVGLTLARYQGWFITGYVWYNSPIFYMFGDAAGWNGHRALPVLQKPTNESALPYMTSGLTPPAFSLGPNNALYCAFAQFSPSGQGALSWGMAVPDDSHLFWYPPQTAMIRQASGQMVTTTVAANTWPGLASNATNEILFAVYASAQAAPSGAYAIHYASLTYQDGQPTWTGNDTIGMVDDLGFQPNTFFSPAALVVGDILYVAFVASTENYLYLIWGFPQKDASGSTEIVWKGSQANVNGTNVDVFGPPSLALLGGRIVVTYACGYSCSSGNNTGLAAQCNFDPQTGTWAGDRAFRTDTNQYYSCGRNVACYGLGQALMIAFAGGTSQNEFYFGTVANIA
ncbi:MAG TPA: metallophosphoesterase [Xanthobacteraceae bacterium]